MKTGTFRKKVKKLPGPHSMGPSCPSRGMWRNNLTFLRNVPGLLLCALLAVISGQARAHNLAPAYLELRELGDGAVAVLWKLPAVVPRGARLEPALPCPAAGEPASIS